MAQHMSQVCTSRCVVLCPSFRRTSRRIACPCAVKSVSARCRCLRSVFILYFQNSPISVSRRYSLGIGMFANPTRCLRASLDSGVTRVLLATRTDSRRPLIRAMCVRILPQFQEQATSAGRAAISERIVIEPHNEFSHGNRGYSSESLGTSPGVGSQSPVSESHSGEEHRGAASVHPCLGSGHAREARYHSL